MQQIHKLFYNNSLIIKLNCEIIHLFNLSIVKYAKSDIYLIRRKSLLKKQAISSENLSVCTFIVATLYRVYKSYLMFCENTHKSKNSKII
jgi:hypothetical protein